MKTTSELYDKTHEKHPLPWMATNIFGDVQILDANGLQVIGMYSDNLELLQFIARAANEMMPSEVVPFERGVGAADG